MSLCGQLQEEERRKPDQMSLSRSPNLATLGGEITTVASSFQHSLICSIQTSQSSEQRHSDDGLHPALHPCDLVRHPFARAPLHRSYLLQPSASNKRGLFSPPLDNLQSKSSVEPSLQ